jgi:hypothetical protein
MKIPKGKEAFKKWIYTPKEQNFFFLCKPHIKLLKRPEDLDMDLLVKKPTICDYPDCPLKAEREFFPNLVTIFQKANKK